MWVSGFGDKPIWSKSDAAFLGKRTSSNAPIEGEPTFDDSVFSIEITERERYDRE